jgi:hypothetical protein
MPALTDSQKWLTLLGVAAAGALLYLLAPVLTPFLVAALLAYVTDPLADRLEALGLSRTMAVVIVDRSAVAGASDRDIDKQAAWLCRLAAIYRVALGADKIAT